MTLAASWQLAGRLRVVPGADQPLVGSRPAADAGLLRRLVRGRAAAAVPELLATLFSLCGEQHRLTSQRALAAAAGRQLDARAEVHERAYLRAACLREHLIHLGLDRPARVPVSSTPADITWLQQLPSLRPYDPHPEAPSLKERAASMFGGLLEGARLASPPLELSGAGLSDAAVGGALRRLVELAEERILGLPVTAWCARYGEHALEGVTRWAHEQREVSASAAWLTRVRERASALELGVHPRSVLDDDARDLPLLAAALRDDPRFTEHAHIAGAPAETGPFNRSAWPISQRTGASAYALLAARVIDVVQLCRGVPWLQLGAQALGPGEAVAFSEIGRGLLVHWVKLSAARGGRAMVEDYRVVTPTDFALHPDGALATRLRSSDLTPSDVQLLIAAFDPCLQIEVTPGVERSEPCTK